MKTTVVGDFEDFATASRVAAELMVAGFAQSEISIVGRDELAHAKPAGASRFAFAGALAQDLAGAREGDFRERLVAGLARLCVPPRAAMRHAQTMLHGGGLVAIHTDVERARRAANVMRRFGTTEGYAAGMVPMTRATRSRADALLSS
jgi:hypothetical protein